VPSAALCWRRSAVRWAVGPYGPVPPCPSNHAKSERTRSVLALAAAAAPALEVRRRCEQVCCWNRLYTDLSIPPLVAVLAQKLPMRDAG
jgi:hypothetical protein